MRIIRCRKGISGVIAGIFMVVVFLLIIVFQTMIQQQQNVYNQAVEDRNQFDLDRLNEKVKFVYAKIDESDQLNITIANIGGINAHLVDMFVNAYESDPPDNPLYQQIYDISYYIDPGHKVNFIAPGAYNESQEHVLKIVTERGNIISVREPYPSASEGGGGASGFYPLIIEDETDNFMYQDLENAYHIWKSAWIKERSSPTHWHCLYKVLLNNTTEMDIELDASSVMLQSGGTQSEVVRRIVSKNTDIDYDLPTPFVSQTIPAKTADYVYFAAAPDTGDWCADPNLPYAPISFLINFRYDSDDETVLRTLGLPVQVQQLG